MKTSKMTRDTATGNVRRFIKPKTRRLVVLSVAGLIASGATVVYSLKFTSSEPPEPPPPSELPIIESVTALGRLEPQGEVIELSPPPTLGAAKVAQLLVQEGDQIQAGQMIAILDDYPRRLAEVERAKKEVAVAQANLAVIRAGAKTGEIQAQEATIERMQAQLIGENAINRAKIATLEAQLQGELQEQRATIERLQAELANARTELERYQYLANEGAISESELDRRRLTLATARARLVEARAAYEKQEAMLQQQIQEARAVNQQAANTLEKQVQEARANLDRISEVRYVDVQKAQAELARAQAALTQTQAELELSTVKAPVASKVLNINARPGESVSDAGIADLGQTDSMMVVAEVYESDISKVRLGQPAIVISESGAFDQKLQGTVSQIGLVVGKNDVLDTDPAADVDTRVVEVKILLEPEDSRSVAGLTNSKVIAEIFI
ncbi:MAG: ABC exporter membrane fusion protein [Cyanophyceae cyanobacterium]